MGSAGSNQASLKPSKGYYICTANPDHTITWEMWHEQFRFKPDDPPGTCGTCGRKGSPAAKFIWHPAAGIPPAEALSFEPPDMEDFIDGILD